MNPYAAPLGDRDPLAVIAASPAQLAAVIQALGPQRVDQPIAPGKWSPRQMACHLADCEIAFSFRLRQALAEDHHVIQPFDQDKWARPYAAYTAGAALELYGALRAWNRALVASLPPQAMSKTVTHPERGDMPFRELLETMAGHDLHHLAQLENAAKTV
ncbi:MAG TPA: DinB family protein [Terriglobales bacterium]|nr:DinB family protein [Terriglobales bacterium]